jgi:kynurenine formamidase
MPEMKPRRNVVDLTHPITPDMPVYPGTEPPQIVAANTIERDGFAEKLIRFYSHTGTHIDAPGHILPGKRTLDRFPASQFFGRGLVIDTSASGKTNIELDDVQPYREQIETSDFVLFHTGWSGYWGTPLYFGEYPVMAPAVAEWLVSFPIKGIGVDVISVDPITGDGLPVHRVILGADKVIIENLVHLDQLAGVRFDFSCLPLYLQNADGSPIRAVAVLSPEA